MAEQLRGSAETGTGFWDWPDKPPAAAALPKPEPPLLKAYRQEEVRCLRVLCDYLHLLESWKVQYAPSNPNKTGVPNGTQQSGSVGEKTSSEMSELSPQGGSEGYAACEDEDDRFVEACQMLDYVEYLADLLIADELEQRVKIVEMLNKDGLIAGLEERLDRLKKEDDAHEKQSAA